MFPTLAFLWEFFIYDGSYYKNFRVLENFYFCLEERESKTGTNILNWRDVEHYFKKILSIFYVFNVHYLSLKYEYKSKNTFIINEGGVRSKKQTKLISLKRLFERDIILFQIFIR